MHLESIIHFSKPFSNIFREQLIWAKTCVLLKVKLIRDSVLRWYLCSKKTKDLPTKKDKHDMLDSIQAFYILEELSNQESFSVSKRVSNCSVIEVRWNWRRNTAALWIQAAIVWPSWVLAGRPELQPLWRCSSSAVHHLHIFSAGLESTRRRFGLSWDGLSNIQSSDVFHVSGSPTCDHHPWTPLQFLSDEHFSFWDLISVGLLLPAAAQWT